MVCKNILLLGSTGFIGKVTLERLIHTLNDDKDHDCTRKEQINSYSNKEANRGDEEKKEEEQRTTASATSTNTIYVLIRPESSHKEKGNSSSTSSPINDRFEALSKSPCFDNCRDVLMAAATTSSSTPFTVIPVVGDFTKPNLGLSNSTSMYVQLMNDITHIISLAASTDFDLPIKQAVEINVNGNLNVLQFAKSCVNLQRYCHCSTAYVWPRCKSKETLTLSPPMDEVLLPDFTKEEHGNIENKSSSTAYKLYKFISQSESFSKEQESKILEEYGMLNTYTFSKALSEVILNEEKEHVPLVIVRPSIVGPSMKHPCPGWVDSISAIAGIVFMYGGGFMHTRFGNMKTKVDIVPCDYVVERILFATFDSESQNSVIQAVAGESHSTTVGEALSMIMSFFNAHTNKKLFLKPFLHLKKNKTTEELVKDDSIRLQRLSTLMKLLNKKRESRTLLKLSTSIFKVIDSFTPFAEGHWKFISTSSQISEFAYDFDPNEYMALICKGVHQFLLNRRKTLLTKNYKNSNNNGVSVGRKDAASSVSMVLPSHTLTFDNLTFTTKQNYLDQCRDAVCKTLVCTSKNDVIKGKDNQKILSDISGSIQSGNVVCVMGPSGAGKTTLLNVLTLQASYGSSFGNIKLNGKPLDSRTFKSACFTVGQFDKNWQYLTVKETCTFAAQLFGIRNIEDKVDDVIDNVGLQLVFNSRNGNLSGGQQRRLSLAIALLKEPEVLFLDEVTSGLDSASAHKICKILRQLADEKNIIIVCTIHQPSTKIFLECFNQLILLSNGRLVYSGGTYEAEDYFANLGYHVPLHTNPSEYYLELINSDFSPTSKKQIDQIITAYQHHYVHGMIVPSSFSSDVIDLGHSDYNKEGNLMKSNLIMLKRHLIMTLRDPVLYLGRCVAALVMNCIFAIVYWDARHYTQDQVMAKAWLVVWYFSVPIMFDAVAVFTLNEEISSIQREQKNGMVKAISYVLAKTVITLPFILLFAIFALGIPGWLMQNYPSTGSFKVLLLWSIHAYVFESLAECLAVCIKDKVMGVLVFLAYWIAAFLFSGLFYPLEDLLPIVKPLYYVTPFSYYIRSMFYLLFSGVTFVSCKSEFTPLEPICVESGSGPDVIDALNKILPLFENKDSFMNDIGILVVMLVVFKALFILGIILKGRNTSIPILPRQNLDDEHNKTAEMDQEQDNEV